jgi:hypothetical protein
MRDLHDLDRYRDCSQAVVDFFGDVGDSEMGAFIVPSPLDGASMRVIASSGEGWDHVSISRRNRCPNWIEMEHVKRLFFHDDETAMQLHVPPSDHRCLHPYALHLWRPLDREIPRPPNELVGTDPSVFTLRLHENSK